MWLLWIRRKWSYEIQFVHGFAALDEVTGRIEMRSEMHAGIDTGNVAAITALHAFHQGKFRPGVAGPEWQVGPKRNRDIDEACHEHPLFLVTQ